MKSDTKLLAAGLIFAFAVATQAGCTGPTKAAMKTSEQASLEGKVVETMNAGGYTYICLEKDGKKTWAAVPTMKVAVGDEVKLLPGAPMPNFTSPTLNRTFESIVFSGGPVTDAQAQQATLPAGHPAMTQAGQAGQAVKAAKGEKPAPPVLTGKVVETMNAGGYTYVCLEKDGRKSWSAVPVTKVNVGDEIELQPGVEMGQFTSKTLNRTFENITFSPGVVKK